MERVTVTIPDEVFTKDGATIARELLERATLEAYRAELISVGRLAEILGFSLDEANSFLKTSETAGIDGYGQESPFYERATALEWIREFTMWADSHDPDTPALTLQDVSRESIYPDR